MSGAGAEGRFRIGVDIGGTFTDVTVVADDGRVLLWKEDTTHGQLELGIEAGLLAVADQLGIEIERLLGECALFVHGSTVATNTLIERDGPLTGLVCTEGFRDALYLRDGFKWDRYNPNLPHPEDLVPRRLRLGVAERIGADGAVVEPLDEDSVRAVAARFGAECVEAVAVALLWSHLNPAHEQRIRELFAELLPGVPVVLSSEILPEVGEWRRTSASVLAAYVYPRTADYLGRLEEWLTERGLRHRLQIMQVNGGCATVAEALRVPVGMVASGPAAAPAAARHLGESVGERDVIEIDIGGTSLDVCVIRDGEVPLSRTVLVDDQPLGIPAVEIHSIGAGGGSIAGVDPGGALYVGPRSAGSRPGPVAYGRGGTEPTVTDANVILGYLEPESFLGGRRRLRDDLARAAMIERVAEPLGLDDAEQAAAGVIAIVNQNMADAIRAVSVERGIDPRGFLLVAGGGAGALHAGRLARALRVPRILVPNEAGTLSAFGMTVTDVRHDHAAPLHTDSHDPDLEAIAAVFAELEARAREQLERSGVPADRVVLERSVDARYAGQIHELIAPVPGGELNAAAVAETAAGFAAAHAERYSYALDEHPVEFLHWRVTGLGLLPRHVAVDFDGLDPVEPPAPRLVAPAYFAEAGGFVETPRYQDTALAPGTRIEGPAVIERASTTVLVLPEQVFSADSRGNAMIADSVGRKEG